MQVKQERFYQWSLSSNKWIFANASDQQPQQFEEEAMTTVTLNILLGKPTQNMKTERRPNVVFSQQRYHMILGEFGKTLPHFISLQEVTKQFLILLEECQWARKLYFVSEVSTNPDRFDNHGSGNILMSRIKPQSLHKILVHYLPRRVVIGFFKIRRNQKVENFTMSSIHLTAFNYNLVRRQRQLEQIVAYLNKFNSTVDYNILHGDLNLHLKEEDNLLKKLNLQDCWNWKHDENVEPGYTFDALKNLMINEIYWGFEKRRMRLDRILILRTKLQNEIKPSQIELCFNKPLYVEGNYQNANFMPWNKGVVSFIFDQFKTSIYRRKEEYLFPSDHFAIKATFKSIK